ncbi:MAG TPA: glycosyltransferase family 39 protein [Pirellulales bacterium]|nr:glycosyltransferase family 39 protein [Pirellulales bacterium]
MTDGTGVKDGGWAGAGWHLLVLVTLSGLLFLANLGAAGLWDEDEPIFAGAAREMMDRGEWIVPYFNWAMIPDKPVLLYWVMIGAYRAFGVTEFAARCGPALFGVGSVLLTWLLGRRLFSPAAGFWAGVILATSVNFDVVARAATPDTLLTFFSTLSILCYAWGAKGLRGDAAGDHDPGQTTRLAMIGSYAAMGMAVLAKGPIGVILPAATIGLYVLTSITAAQRTVAQTEAKGWRAAVRQSGLALAQSLHPTRVVRAILRMYPLTGLTVVLAVAGPWYVAVGMRTEGAWLAGFFGKHNLGRFLHPMEHHRGPFFYYLIAIVIGFFPWSLFLGPAGVHMKSRWGDDREGNPYRLLLCWLVTYLGFFSLAATKLPNYIVPVYPALALLVGACLDAWLSGRQDLPFWLVRRAWVTSILIGIAFVVVLPIVALRFLGGDTILAFTGLPLIVGGGLCWWWHRRARPRRAAAAFAVMAACFSLAVFAGGTAEVDRHQTSALFARVVHRHTGGELAIVRSFGYWRPSLVFYLRQPVQQFFYEEQIREFCQAWPYRGFLLTTSDRYALVGKYLPSDVCVLERKRWFLRSQDLLLLGRKEPSITSSDALACNPSPKN